MIAVNMKDIKKSYGIEDVLSKFSLAVNIGEKVALIGPNGSGKTTVFKIIAGVEKADAGQISLKKDISVGFLNQIPDFNPEKTLYRELTSVFQNLLNMENRLNKLEQIISRKSSENKNKEELEALMEEYSQIQHNYELQGGYEYESKIRQVAYGLGFDDNELEKKCGVLSGGEKTRLALVQLLLSEPDILLLDEPTNHLDIPSRQWLEEYIKNYSGAVLIISHDRYFLDRVVNRTVELKQGKSEVYNGNYTYYLRERKERYERRLQAYKDQQKKIKELEEAIKNLHQWGQRSDSSKLARRAKSMEKRLEKMERIPRPTLAGSKMNLELDFSSRSGDEVVIIKDLYKSFPGEDLLSGIDFSLYWGEKVALIGKNGTGKTTIIKLIKGNLEPDRGSIKIGAGVRIGYYSQEFSGFNPEDDLITALRREAAMNEKKARNALAAFLFTGDEVFKKVKDLSGGEKSRLRLLQLMNGDYNFLLLDEPTNHLDLPSREVLEDVLKKYPGTVLVVSHDRYFINKFVENIYELEEGKLTRYYGNYDYYRRKKEELRSDSNPGNDEDKTQVEKSEYHRLKEEKKQRRKRERNLKQLEAEITENEELLEELERKMTEPDNLSDFEKLRKLKKEYSQIQERLEGLYLQWESYL